MDASAREDGHDEPARARLASSRSSSGGCCSTTRSRSTAAARSTSTTSAAPATQRVEIVRWLTERSTSRSCSSSSSWPPTTSTTSAGPSGSERGRDSTRRRGLPDPRRRARRPAQGGRRSRERRRRRQRARRLRPRRRLARRRRQPQRLARAGGLAHVRRTSKGEGTRKLGHQLFELRRRFPKHLRYSFKQRMPWLRERAYKLRGYSIVDWPRTQAFSYGLFGNIVINLRGRERVRASSSPARSTRRCATRSPSGCSSCARRPATRSSPPCTAARISTRGPELEKIPDLIVEFRDYAWLGKGNLTAARTRSGTDHDPAAHAAGVRRQPPQRRHLRARRARRPRPDASAREIKDVAPTIMYLLGEPIPSDLEGRLLTRRSTARCSTPGRRSTRTQIEVAVGDSKGESPRGRGRGAPAQPRLPRVSAQLHVVRAHDRSAGLGASPRGRPGRERASLRAAVAQRSRLRARAPGRCRELSSPAGPRRRREEGERRLRGRRRTPRSPPPTVRRRALLGRSHRCQRSYAQRRSRGAAGRHEDAWGTDTRASRRHGPDARRR